MEQNYKDKLYAKYSELLPSIKELEAERKKMLFIRNFLKATGIIICVFVVLISLFLLFGAKSAKSTAIADYIMLYICSFCAVSAICVFIMQLFNKNEYDKNFARMMKDRCFGHLFEVFDFIKASRIKGLEFNSMYKKGLDRHQREIEPKVDDTFEGSYNDVDFSITEVSQISMRGKLGCYTGWSGVILKLQFNKFAKTEVYLSPKSDMGAVIMLIAGVIGIITGLLANFFVFLFSILWTGLLGWVLICKLKQKVVLEDNSFHKEFYVEAKDQVEARYILTPSFMERLKKLETAFGAKNITCMIQGNSIILAIRTNRDLFEIGNLNVPVTSSEQIKQFYNEITAICDIIDHFKLNERTGL